jgi:hypothetical protein
VHAKINVFEVMMSKRILWSSILSLVVGFRGSASASNFGDTYGFGATGIAMGNAMTAVASDWSSVYYNMAGLGKTVHQKGAAAKEEGDRALSLKKKEDGKEEGAAPQKAFLSQLAFSYMYNMPQTSIDYKGTNTLTETDVPASAHIILGVVVDLNLIYQMPKFISSARLGLGLGANGDGTIVKLNDVSPKTHDYLRLGREEQKAMILAGAGFGFINDTFGFGVGANVGFKGQGSVLMGEVEVSDEEQVPDSQSKMDLSAMPTMLAGVYFSPGRIWDAVKGLELGASYRQEHYMKIDPFKAGADVPGLMQMQLLMAIYDYYSPDIFTFGVSYTRWQTTLSFDIDYQMWSQNRYSSTLNKNYPDLPAFQDVISPKLGVKYDALSWFSVMAGYIYQPSFVPDGAVTGACNFLDNDKHIASLGLKLNIPQFGGFRGPLEITIGYQYQSFVPRTVKKDDPANQYNPSYAYGGSAQSVIVEIMMKL